MFVIKIDVMAACLPIPNAVKSVLCVSVTNARGNIVIIPVPPFPVHD